MRIVNTYRLFMSSKRKHTHVRAKRVFPCRIYILSHDPAYLRDAKYISTAIIFLHAKISHASMMKKSMEMIMVT
jgi:hypothetical protein